MTEVAAQKRLGVYGWVRSHDVPGTSFFFPINSEDVGKREATPLSMGLVPLIPGMMGIIAGGVDPEDQFLEMTVHREAREERDISVSLAHIHNTLPTIPVSQFRRGEMCTFDVHGHSVHITQAELERLQNATPVTFVQDEALDRFLREQKDKLRPSVYLAGKRILQSGALARI